MVPRAQDDSWNATIDGARLVWLLLAALALTQRGSPEAQESGFLGQFVYRLPVIRQCADLSSMFGEWLNGFWVTNVKYPHMISVLTYFAFGTQMLWTAFRAGSWPGVWQFLGSLVHQ